MLPQNPTPVGVFDSGVGGLCVLKTLQSVLPNESFIYAADSANAPYGGQSKAFIEERASAMVRFLLNAKAKCIVVACNTATVVAVETLRAICPVPVIAMEPAVKPAVRLTRSGIVGVLATERTLESPALANLCRLYGQEVKLVLQPCPGLVEQVERGDIKSDFTRRLLWRYVSLLLESGADTIVLGCTHYVFLKSQIEDLAGPGVAVVESSAAVALQLRRRLAESGNLTEGAGHSQMTFFTTGPVDEVTSIFSALWGTDVHVHALKDPESRTGGVDALAYKGA